MTTISFKKSTITVGTPQEAHLIKEILANIKGTIGFILTSNPTLFKHTTSVNFLRPDYKTVLDKKLKEVKTNIESTKIKIEKSDAHCPTTAYYGSHSSKGSYEEIHLCNQTLKLKKGVSSELKKNYTCSNIPIIDANDSITHILLHELTHISGSKDAIGMKEIRYPADCHMHTIASLSIANCIAYAYRIIQKELICDSEHEIHDEL